MIASVGVSASLIARPTITGVPRVLLILPSATYRAHDFTQAAAALGAELVVASDRRQAMSEFLGDRALVLPLQRPEEAAERVVAHHAQRLPLDAVVAVDDQGVQTAALAAERLGLKTSDPGGRRAHARQGGDARGAGAGGRAAAGLPAREPRRGRRARRELGFPVVVKPLSLSASRGVIRADDASRPPPRPRSASARSPATPTSRCWSSRSSPATRSRSRACCAAASSSRSRCSTSPTRSTAPTSRRRSTSRRRASRRRRSSRSIERGRRGRGARSA